MAERKGGLGDWGKERAKYNLGQRTVAGHKIDEETYEAAITGNLPAPAPTPPTAWEQPASTRVSAYQYDPESQQLRVRFLKYRTPWVYEGVPTAVFQAFDAAPSKGMYINSTLNYFPYRKATPQEEAQYFRGV